MRAARLRLICLGLGSVLAVILSACRTGLTPIVPMPAKEVDVREVPEVVMRGFNRACPGAEVLNAEKLLGADERVDYYALRFSQEGKLRVAYLIPNGNLVRINDVNVTKSN